MPQLTIKEIKGLGRFKEDKNFDILLNLYETIQQVDLRREIVSSIGRQVDKDRVLQFITDNYKQEKIMDVVYQMYRTILYNIKDPRFSALANEFRIYFNNEMIEKMDYFFNNKGPKKIKPLTKSSRSIKQPLLLEGDNKDTLLDIPDDSVQLIFTSPPYYNAKMYSTYRSYNDYLEDMRMTISQCNRVLERGRFIVINVSPVISRRPGREFESIRHPIHFDFHNILVDCGFEFIDEIIWAKPEPASKNRGGFKNTRKPLAYKAKAVTESILVYRKKAPFQIDENILQYDRDDVFPPDYEIHMSNLWKIAPSHNRNHPAIFPNELCDRVIQYFSYKNDIVLDPWAGSGTLGKRALILKRIPILCEINNEYINMMKKSIKLVD